MDIALVVAAFAISLTYLIEIDSVCLIDTITGERARIIAETLKAEVEFAETMGLPVPDTVDDPKCVATTGVATTGVATTGAATTGVATTGVATTGVPTTGVATTGVATTGVAILQPGI